MATNTLQLTILYEEGEDGWTIASVPEVPGTHSQGRTREEARANVVDALEIMLTPTSSGPRTVNSPASQSNCTSVR